MDDNQYQEEFFAACERTRRLGYSAETVSFNDKRFAAGTGLAQIAAMLQKLFGSTTPERIGNNCVEINEILHDYINEYNLFRAYFTIGYFRIDGDYKFKFSETDLQRWLADGHTGTAAGLNLHAWLTLESLELIDATLPTSVGLSSKDSRLLGSVITCRPSELNGDLTFHPMIVGADIIGDIAPTRYVFIA